MKYHRVLGSVIVALFLFNLSSNAQIDISSVSIKLGSIRSLSGYAYYKSVLNPELQIGGVFISKYFGWSVYWSYWDDGSFENILSEGPIFSFSGHIVGLRMSFSLTHIDDNWIIPIEIFAGVAEHFIKAREIYPIYYSIRIGSDYSKTATTCELGLSLPINIIGSWSILAEAQQYFPLGSSVSDKMQRDRRAYKVGLSYSL
jgi:hypothetical protein